MERYTNKTGDSNIAEYEVGSGCIQIRFSSSAKIYTYSYSKAGIQHVDQMIQLARNGSGLNSYINKYVKNLTD